MRHAIGVIPFLLAMGALANAQTGTFTATGSMTTPRFQQTVTVLANGQVLVAGGADQTNPFNAVASAELYDPATGVFTATGSMSTPRMDHTATLLPNGQVLIEDGNGGPFPTAELYDPATGTFSLTGPLTVAQGFSTATLLLNGKVLFAGSADNTGALANAELYDPGTGSFSPTGSMITARVGQYAVLLANGQVLMAGGANAPGGNATVLASAELYDPTTGTFSATGSLNIARESPGTAVLLENGKVLFAGGANGPGGNSGVLASAELYDPTTGTFSLTGSMTVPRTKHNAVLLSSGQVLVMGGVNPSGFGPLASAELYDPTSGTFSLTGAMTLPRFFVLPTAVVLPDGQVLVAGGADNGPVASAELYTGVLPPPAPAIDSSPANPTNQTSASFTFSDTQAGVTFVCSLDSSSFTDCAVGQTYPGLGQGSHTFSVEAEDSAGNRSTPTSFSWTVDTAPPTISGSATPPANGYGWNNTSVTVSFTCFDALSGIASCSSPTTLTTQGAGQSVTGTAIDKAGNMAQATVTVNIDETNPTVTYTGNAGTYTVDQTVAITCTAADALSGVASTTCANINGAAYSFGLGAHSYSAAATDKAGNAGNAPTSFTIQVTFASLGNLVTRFVSNPGIANALLSKLSAAQASAARGNANSLDGQLGAFINQVSAQSGKSLSGTQAAILIQLATALMM